MKAINRVLSDLYREQTKWENNISDKNREQVLKDIKEEIIAIKSAKKDQESLKDLIKIIKSGLTE